MKIKIKDILIVIVVFLIVSFIIGWILKTMLGSRYNSVVKSVGGKHITSAELWEIRRADQKARGEIGYGTVKPDGTLKPGESFYETTISGEKYYLSRSKGLEKAHNDNEYATWSKNKDTPVKLTSGGILASNKMYLTWGTDHNPDNIGDGNTQLIDRTDVRFFAVWSSSGGSRGMNLNDGMLSSNNRVLSNSDTPPYSIESDEKYAVFVSDNVSEIPRITMITQ
tara:strand:+ start:675 stop:1346 length:672 start_codon:yes stop_codon:yes gene_type:complete